MTQPVIMFAFWGRRANVELQLPFIERILDENPNVEFHGWNLANDRDDREWLHKLRGRERFVVRNDLASPRGQHRINQVWQHYTASVFAETMFVKIDDDVVFMQADRFAEFIAAIEGHSDAVVSALTVNNGACTPLLLELWKDFVSLNIPLLDVHKSNEYAEAAHAFFFNHWHELLSEPVKMVPTEEWVSINCIGMTSQVLGQISSLIGKPSPRLVAGREWTARTRMGDEGAANLLPRHILRGFAVAHLGFGPQKVSGEQAALWRQRYGEIAGEYLAGVQKLNAS
jgi:hypothetical protein